MTCFDKHGVRVDIFVYSRKKIVFFVPEDLLYRLDSSYFYFYSFIIFRIHNILSLIPNHLFSKKEVVLDDGLFYLRVSKRGYEVRDFIRVLGELLQITKFDNHCYPFILHILTNI